MLMLRLLTVTKVVTSVVWECAVASEAIADSPVISDTEDTVWVSAVVALANTGVINDGGQGMVVLDLSLNGYNDHYCRSPVCSPMSLNRAFCSSLSDA